MLEHVANLSVRLAGMLGERRTGLMGIVNVTPNSFSDTGKHWDAGGDAGAAIEHGRLLVRQGAGILDLGGEASSFFRAGVEAVDPEEQLRRLMPVIKGLAADGGVILSVDTRSARVAREAVLAGVHVVNDISAGTHDSAMLGTVAELGVPLVLMHISPSFPANAAVEDPNIEETVRDYLLERAAAAREAGVASVWVDPGVGFGKTARENVRLAMGFSEREDVPLPMVLGVSRKRFLGSKEFGELGLAEEAGWEALAGHERDGATAAVVRFHGERKRRWGLIHRVHNVALAARALGLPGVCG